MLAAHWTQVAALAGLIVCFIAMTIAVFSKEEE